MLLSAQLCCRRSAARLLDGWLTIVCMNLAFVLLGPKLHTLFLELVVAGLLEKYLVDQLVQHLTQGHVVLQRLSGEEQAVAIRAGLDARLQTRADVTDGVGCLHI